MLKAEVERRVLQGAIVAGCVVPLLTGGAGMIVGADMLRGVDAAPADLDSHYRYLSGLLFGVGVGFLSCVPRMEARGPRLRLLGLIVLIGGLARAYSLVEDGSPSLAHRLALGMELLVVPALLLWQWRFAARWRASHPSADTDRQAEPSR